MTWMLWILLAVAAAAAVFLGGHWAGYARGHAAGREDGRLDALEEQVREHATMILDLPGSAHELLMETDLFLAGLERL